MTTANPKEQWSSRAGFLLAAIGSAVGLANIWRFPYTAGENGGGAFVFVYLCSAVMIVLPILIAELLVGRRGQLSPPASIAKLAKEAGKSQNWRWMGLIGGVAVLVVFSFYMVVGGWTMAYVVKAASSEWVNSSYPQFQASFDGLNANALQLFGWASLFLVLTVWISAQGIKAGIERASKILMPMFFILLLALVVYSAVVGDFAKAARFLFVVDFSKMSSEVVLEAIGQSFFSIGVGMTNFMAYGAYLNRQVNIPTSSAIIVASDALVAVLAGLAIFPLVFAYGMDPAGGPGLVFMTLPFAFSQMPLGQVIGPLFFILLFFAAITSSISMLECAVSWLAEKTSWSRKKATLCCGAVTWLLGILSVLSFNHLSGYYPLNFMALFESKTFFNIFEYITSNLIMPLGSIFIAYYVGWVLPKQITSDELDADNQPLLYQIWLVLVRYVAPVGVAVMFISLI
jgi:NSS family neurotransmitter:Na+ symporter